MTRTVRRKSAHGRAANQADRDHARQLVELARAAFASSDGRVCVNPEDEYEIRSYWSIENLISDLEQFAETGRFVSDDFWLRGMRITMRFKELLQAGMKRREAIERLAAEHRRSEKTIERIIRGIKTR
jgi:hypothetical protein